MKAFKLDINHVYDVLANDDGGIEELLEDPALEDPEALSELFAIVAMAEAGRKVWTGDRYALINFASKRLDFRRFITLAILTEFGPNCEKEYSDVPGKLKKALRRKKFSEKLNREIRELYGKTAKQVIKYVFYELDEIDSGYIPTLVKLMFDELCTSYETLFLQISMSISEKTENA